MADRCRFCNHPIIPADTSTGWIHGGPARAWQGVRCPGRVTGAVPRPPWWRRLWAWLTVQ
jgi:hypothetical protein